MRKPLRDFVIALSLSNLFFLSVWLLLLNKNHYAYYYWKADPGYVEFAALGLGIICLAALFWLTATVVHRSNARPARIILRWAFLAALIVPINSVALHYTNTSVLKLGLMNKWAMTATLAGAVALGVCLYRSFPRVVGVCIILVIILAPMVVVNFASVAWLRLKYAPSPASLREKVALPPITTRTQSPRIIWIVFDELDQNTAFVSRPTHLSLPEFDRFSSDALVAENAYSPSWTTLRSMPALMTGQLLADATPIAADELELTTTNGVRVVWSEQSSVFSEAQAEGFSTGLAGWYHPYCRVIGSSLDWCSWTPVIGTVNPVLDKLTLRHSLLTWVRQVLYSVPLIFRLMQTRDETEFKMAHTTEFNSVTAAADSLLAQDLNLTLLHFPIPHDPWIYDASRRVLSTNHGNSYLDNVVLADRTLGEIRSRLEVRNRWDSSIVLVTSDHWWRESPLVDGKRDHRIPFMLKLAGQKSSVEYAAPFNTILTRELLLQLLRGNLVNPNELVGWLKGNSQFGRALWLWECPDY